MAWGIRSSGAGGDGCAGRLALVLAILALFLAWSAYRRTGGSFETLLEKPWNQEAGGSAEENPDESAEAAESEEWRIRLNEARDRLQERRDEIAAEQNLDQVREDIERIRQDLRRAYDGASSVRDRWRQVDAELEQLGNQVEAGSDRAVRTLDSVVERMKGWGDER